MNNILAELEVCFDRYENSSNFWREKTVVDITDQINCYPHLDAGLIHSIFELFITHIGGQCTISMYERRNFLLNRLYKMDLVIPTQEQVTRLSNNLFNSPGKNQSTMDEVNFWYKHLSRDGPWKISITEDQRVNMRDRLYTEIYQRIESEKSSIYGFENLLYNFIHTYEEQEWMVLFDFTPSQKFNLGKSIAESLKTLLLHDIYTKIDPYDLRNVVDASWICHTKNFKKCIIYKLIDDIIGDKYDDFQSVRCSMIAQLVGNGYDLLEAHLQQFTPTQELPIDKIKDKKGYLINAILGQIKKVEKDVPEWLVNWIQVEPSIPELASSVEEYRAERAYISMS